MNKEEEIKKEIKEAQERLQQVTETLERAQKKLEDLENNNFGWWKPEDGDLYYYLDSRVNVQHEYYKPSSVIAQQKLTVLNCFRNEKEAYLERQRIILGRKIRDIAIRLNKDQKIDWSDYEQKKYRLFTWYDRKTKEISIGSTLCGRQDITDFVCLNPLFDTVVKDELMGSLKHYFELKDMIDESN